MTQDKSLLAILGVIAVLVAAALALFFLRQGQQAYLAQDTPSAVMHDYLLALQKGDYQRAYSYLYDGDSKPDLFTFKQAFADDQLSVTTSSVQIGDEQVTGAQAVVTLILTQNQSDPFSQPYRNWQPANLVRQNSAWKVQFAPYPYWGYNWYQGVIPAGKPTLTVPAATPGG